jgi:hypothetical protein
LYLRNKLVAIVQKFPLLHHKMTKWIHPHGAIISTMIIIAVLWDGQREHLEFPVDLCELVC